jgi:predicted small lipoprotein YifL
VTGRPDPLTITAIVFTLFVAGCGLKGPLSLPEKSEAVILRGGAQTPAGEGAATPSTPPAAPGTPAAPATQPSAPATAPPNDDQPPPPPLPGGNPGTSRGG